MDFKNERLMMSEEEARNRAKELLKETQVDLITQYMFLEQQCKKQKEVIDKAIELLNNPWSFESGNKEVDEITYNKKRKVIDILKEVSEWNQ